MRNLEIRRSYNSRKISNPKEFFKKRCRNEALASLFKGLSKYGYVVRKKSKVVFITNKTRKSLYYEKRLMNELKDFKLKDISNIR